MSQRNKHILRETGDGFSGRAKEKPVDMILKILTDILIAERFSFKIQTAVSE